MIGKICSFITPYYDSVTKRNSFKSRPVLIIGVPDAGDYNVLPISRVTNQLNLDPNYDFPIDPNNYQLLNLTSKSYVRIHKQLFVHNSAIGKVICDMKADYPDLFLAVLAKLEEYNVNLINDAL